MDEHPNFERLAPTPFSVVCFRARPASLGQRLAATGVEEQAAIEKYLDELNQALLDEVNATGQAYLSHTKLGGRFTLRLAIGNLRTTELHVEKAWRLLRDHAARLDRDRRPPAWR